MEDGLSNLSWETRGYELCPLGSHTHSFHNSERGWKIMPAASERISLLTGIPHGEPSRREIGSETILGPARTGFFNRRTPSMRTLSRTPRSWAIGGGVQTKPQPRLYHSIQPLSGAGCLPRQDGCSYPLRREEPDINTLCPQSTFQELPVMGKEYASLDRSWPPVLGSGERTCSKRAFWTSVVWLSGSVSLDLRRTQPLSPGTMKYGCRTWTLCLEQGPPRWSPPSGECPLLVPLPEPARP